MAARKPLTDDEIAERIAQLPDWVRDGDEISRTFTGTWDECVELAGHIDAIGAAAKNGE
jgi:4a-hydroxytetrahydrobiopterin dehydratase